MKTEIITIPSNYDTGEYVPESFEVMIPGPYGSRYITGFESRTDARAVASHVNHFLKLGFQALPEDGYCRAEVIGESSKYRQKAIHFPVHRFRDRKPRPVRDAMIWDNELNQEA